MYESLLGIAKSVNAFKCLSVFPNDNENVHSDVTISIQRERNTQLTFNQSIRIISQKCTIDDI